MRRELERFGLMTGTLEETEKLVEEKTGNKPGERVTLDHIQALVVAREFHSPNHTPQMIICTLKLRNGFVVVGESRPADPQKFDAELGARLAMDAAIAKIWPLEGYLLHQKLWRAENGEPTEPT
jgi:hypothetical protein